MPRSVKAQARLKRLTIDFDGPEWQRLQAEAERKAREGGTPVKPTHIVRLAVRNYFQKSA